MCMGVDLHKKVGDHGQNINRMPIWGIRTVVTKTSIKQMRWSVSILNTYRTFTSNTDLNMTHNLHVKTWGTCPPYAPLPCPPCDRRRCICASLITIVVVVVIFNDQISCSAVKPRVGIAGGLGLK